MQKIGWFQAKNRLSELVEGAAQGEEIGITRRGKLAAVSRHGRRSSVASVQEEPQTS